MQHFAFAIWIVVALASFVLTLPYLSTGFGILAWPFFPFFGIYAGISEGDWMPSLLFFGALLIAIVFSKRRNSP